MTALLAIITSKLAWAGAAIAMLAAMFGMARRGGKIAERNAQQERESKAVKIAKQVDDDVKSMTDEQRRKELAKWQKL